MSNLFSSGWIVVILAFLNTGLIMALNKLKKDEGPVWGKRSIQAGLIVSTGFMLYFGIIIFAI